MKRMTKIATIAMVTMLLLTVFATTANAQSQSATNNADANVNCTSGAYGQSNNCYAVINQSINQRQTLGVTTSTDRSNLYHQPIGTGVDTTTMMAAMATIITTGAGAVISFKKMVA